MDTWQDIACEDIYDERADTWFLQQELEALEQAELDNVNLDLQVIADELREMA